MVSDQEALTSLLLSLIHANNAENMDISLTGALDTAKHQFNESNEERVTNKALNAFWDSVTKSHSGRAVHAPLAEKQADLYVACRAAIASALS